MQCPASICISLHPSASHAAETRYATCRRFLFSAATSISAANIARLACSPPRLVERLSGLKQQKLHDHVPGGSSLHTTGKIAGLLLSCRRPRSSLRPGSIGSTGGPPGSPSPLWPSTGSCRRPSASIFCYPVLSYLLLLSFALPAASGRCPCCVPSNSLCPEFRLRRTLTPLCMHLGKFFPCAAPTYALTCASATVH